MVHKATMHEQVMEAADRIERNARHDPHFHEELEARNNIFDRASDPNSDWPEPPLKGDHLEKEMARWMPHLQTLSKSPKSPGGMRKMAVHDPVVGGEDPVEGINRGVGGFNANLNKGSHKAAQGLGHPRMG